MDPRLADMDPAELLTRLSEKLTTAEAMHRTLMRAQRGKELYTWGLNPQYADPNSSLAADDAGFMNEYTGDMVSATARFSIMNAIDCLCATAELIEWRPKSRDSHTTSILAQCRTAMESAATTIWLLSDRDRQMRRGLSVRFTTSELNAQRSYHVSTTKWFNTDPNHADTQKHKDFVEHVRPRARLALAAIQGLVIDFFTTTDHARVDDTYRRMVDDLVLAPFETESPRRQRSTPASRAATPQH